MHRFFQHVKTAPGAACSLRCCGNQFANRILRNGAGHRDSHVLPKMRRYVRHAEAQAVRREIQAQLDVEWEFQLDKLQQEVEEMLEILRLEGLYLDLTQVQP